jgi:chitodextrinase
MRRLAAGLAVAGLLCLAISSTAAAAAPPPTNVRVTGVTDTTATIAFTASTDRSVEIYHIYANGEYLTWTSAPGREIPDLRPSTRYTFTVRSATSGDGQFIEGPDSNPATATTRADTTPPGKPEIVVRSKTSTTVDTTWYGNGDNDRGGFLTYVLSNGVSTFDVPFGQYTHNFTGLTIGQTYSFTVRARDEAGNVSQPSDPVRVTMDGTAPSVPRNLRPLNGSVDNGLQWDASTDNLDSRVSYNLYRDGRKTFERLGTPMFSVAEQYFPVTPGRYTVTAIDSSGNESAQSAPFTVS